MTETTESLGTAAQPIAPHEWIRFAYGVDERALLDSLSKQPLASTPCVNRLGLCAGEFGVLSLAELRSALAAATTTATESKPVPMFVIHVRKPRHSDNRYFDTSALQVNKALPAPMFQVASNFNCHENGSRDTDLYDGQYLTDLMTDNTQGPCASAGAGLGAVQRWMLHRQTPINLLKNISLITTENGKATRISRSFALNTVDFDNVCVGLQTNVSACFERSERDQCAFVADAPLIDQIFVSTLCMPVFKASATTAAVAQKLLKCAYDATYMAAMLRNRKTLVLTLVGGGVFRNSIDDIIHALTTAHVAYSRCGALQTVLLPLYESHDRALCVAKAVSTALLSQHYPAERIEIKLC